MAETGVRTHRRPKSRKPNVIDKVRSVRPLVFHIGRPLADWNLTIAHLSLEAEGSNLKRGGKAKLGALYVQLMKTHLEFNRLVETLPPKSQLDSRLADTRSAIEQLTARCRRLLDG